MQRFKHNHIEWLEFDLLADIPHLKHAVFLRQGGSSQGPFHSLNVSYDVGDEPTHVAANLAAIQAILQQDVSDPLHLCWAKQNHGKQVAHIHSCSLVESIHSDQLHLGSMSGAKAAQFCCHNASLGANPCVPDATELSLYCDALVTADKGMALMIKHADCQAAIFYDPTNQAIANVHAGWRGSVSNIYAEIVHTMQQTFGSRPQELLACISPSLGPEEAEFIHYNQELPEELWDFQVKSNYFDFWAISEYQLQAAGLLPHHIEIAKISTYSNAHDYFSYRRERVTGRNGTVVALV